MFHKVDVFGCVAMVMAKLNWQQIINQLNFLHKLIFLHLKRDIIGCLRFSALTNQSLWFSTFKFLVLHMTIFGCLIFLLCFVYYLPTYHIRWSKVSLEKGSQNEFSMRWNFNGLSVNKFSSKFSISRKSCFLFRAIFA